MVAAIADQKSVMWTVEHTDQQRGFLAPIVTCRTRECLKAATCEPLAV